MQRKGALGLIATNTIAQGDSREVGLDAMAEAGFTITRSVQSRSWPAMSANLEYAAVWGTIGPVGDDIARIADGVDVRRISTLLEPAGRVDGNPSPLRENEGVSFIGCYVLGMGFVLDIDEAQEWIAADARNAEVLFPYLNGEDLNSRPDNSASRWVIDFGTREQAQAADYPLPFGRVLRLVKPERDKLKIAYRRDNWWRFAAWAPSLRKAIEDLPEVLVVGLVSKTVMPARVSSEQVFSHKLGVFATDSYAIQAVLSSATHWLWAVKYGSTLETRVNYSPSDVFETFPLPPFTDRLEAVGRKLEVTRKDFMMRAGLGITKLYNLVNDPTNDEPDVAVLRQIHFDIDEAVRDAYGWTDIDLDYGFHRYRKMERWSLGPAAQSEVLDRLLAENHRRSADQGGGTSRPASQAVPRAEGTLFG